jgi:hypothetical protein
MGLEPTTSCLASRHSTTELPPLLITAINLKEEENNKKKSILEQKYYKTYKSAYKYLYIRSDSTKEA